MTMTKKDFINAVAKNGNMTKKSAEEAVAVVLETIMGTLANGDSVNFFGFGKFSAVRQDACVKRNPKTGESVKVPEKLVPKFKYSGSFKKSIAE